MINEIRTKHWTSLKERRRAGAWEVLDAGYGTVAVYEMIMATADHIHAEAKQQHYAGFVADLDLFLDLDLSPLAAPWEKFAANFEKIRFEYSWVPGAEFYSGQLKMLEEYIIAGARLFRRPETTKKSGLTLRPPISRVVSMNCERDWRAPFPAPPTLCVDPTII